MLQYTFYNMNTYILVVMDGMELCFSKAHYPLRYVYAIANDAIIY